MRSPPRAYYSEFNPYVAAWLKKLIFARRIPAGDVDTRDIRAVQPGDLDGYDQCHFFAGIAGWPLALAIAGWPADRPSGPDRVLVSLSARPASAWAPTTSGTAGPTSTGSSRTAALQSSLESRLRARLDERGSPLFALIWKHWAMPWGPPICALRASGRRISGNGFSSWPTPLAKTSAGSATRDPAKVLARATSGRHSKDLQDFVQLASWPTPRAAEAGPDYAISDRPDSGGHSLQTAAAAGGLAHPERAGSQGLAGPGDEPGQPRRLDPLAPRPAPTPGDARGLADADGGDASAARLQRGGQLGQRAEDGRAGGGRPGQADGPWAAADWLLCRDGRWRPVEPRSFPLAHGLPHRLGALRAYGNAIVPPLAAEFVRAFMDLNR